MKAIQVRVLFDRKGQATAKKSALVQLEIRYNKDRKFMSTGVKVCKGQFKNGRVVGREDADVLNDKINALCKKINEIYIDCISTSRNFNLSMIDDDTSQFSKMSFIDFVRKRTEEKRCSEATRRQNRLFSNILELSGIIRDFDDIKLPKVRAFDDWMKSHKGLRTNRPLEDNTIKAYHARLRAFINEAITFELVKQNPYSQFKQSRFQSKPRIVLTMEELEMLKSWTPSTYPRRIALDLFLIQCYTGLSYSDLMATDFTKTEDRNGILFLPRTTRVKTGTQFYIMLLPPVVKILEQYEYILPRIALSQYSLCLKSIEKETKIGKHITSHVGRHTFATTIALGSGIPIEVVSKMLGHTNIQTTQIYAKILPQQVVDGFNKIREHVK